MKKITLCTLLSLILVMFGCKATAGSGDESHIEPPLEQEKVLQPVITLEGKDFQISQNIVITSPTNDVKIFYTLDGTNPSTEFGGSTFAYDESTNLILEFQDEIEIKAIAIKDGKTSDITHTTLTKKMPVVEVIGGDYNGSTINGLHAGIYEVTFGQWTSIMGDPWPGDRDPRDPKYGYGSTENHPAYFLSWYDAIRFCNALSDKEGFDSVYTTTDGAEIDINDSTFAENVTQDNSKNGYRLPSNVEWQYLASGGGVNSLYSGTDDPFTLKEYAWFIQNTDTNKGNPNYGTKVVGSRQPNSLDLYDMSGNVWEWCWDKSPYIATLRNICGGDWDEQIAGVKITSKKANNASLRDFQAEGSSEGDEGHDFVGFRVVRNK